MKQPRTYTISSYAGAGYLAPHSETTIWTPVEKTFRPLALRSSVRGCQIKFRVGNCEQLPPKEDYGNASGTREEQEKVSAWLIQTGGGFADIEQWLGRGKYDVAQVSMYLFIIVRTGSEPLSFTCDIDGEELEELVDEEPRANRIAVEDKTLELRQEDGNWLVWLIGPMGDTQTVLGVGASRKAATRDAINHTEALAQAARGLVDDLEANDD